MSLSLEEPGKAVGVCMLNGDRNPNASLAGA